MPFRWPEDTRTPRQKEVGGIRFRLSQMERRLLPRLREKQRAGDWAAVNNIADELSLTARLVQRAAKRLSDEPKKR